MTKVYVVTTGSYSDYGIQAIFSTREAADRLAAEYGPGDGADVEEYTLDEHAEETRKPIYWCWMNAEGTVYNRGEKSQVCPPRYTQSVFAQDGRYFWGDSSVSPEHAAKLAAEARQAWLRQDGCLPAQ